MGLLSSIFGGGISTKADCDREIARLQGEIEREKAHIASNKTTIKRDKEWAKEYRRRGGNPGHMDFGNLEAGINMSNSIIAAKKARIAELKAMKSSLPKG